MASRRGGAFDVAALGMLLLIPLHNKSHMFLFIYLLFYNGSFRVAQNGG